MDGRINVLLFLVHFKPAVVVIPTRSAAKQILHFEIFGHISKLRRHSLFNFTRNLL